MQELERVKKWICPHHHCGECGRPPTKAGGLLFACQCCASAFCEDHLPPDAHFTYECPRFLHLGHHHPKQASQALHSPWQQVNQGQEANNRWQQAGTGRRAIAGQYATAGNEQNLVDKHSTVHRQQLCNMELLANNN